MELSSRTSIIGALVFADRELTAAQMIELLEPLGMSSTNVKSHLTRMVADGVLIRNGTARLSTYAPSRGQLERIGELRERLRPRTNDWDRTWLLVNGYSPKNRALKERLYAALWMDGFRMLNGAFIRPAWPLPWAEQRARSYAELMEGMCVRGSVVSSTTYLNDLYNVAGLDSEASALADKIEEIEPPTDPRACFVLLQQVGGQVVQLISHDPQLPASFVNQDNLRRLRQTFEKIERAWSPIAREFYQGVLAGSAKPC